MSRNGDDALRIHGTAVAAGPHAVVLRGPSGSGKSDLALRMLTLPPEAVALAFGQALPMRLVADDQVQLTVMGGALIVSAPPSIAGLIEARGVGIVTIGCVDEARVLLVADIVEPATVERLPPDLASAALDGISVAHLRVAALEPSAPIKVLLALARAAAGVAGR